ncbi:MAG: hypothetical protein PV344_04205, partial [Anaplasma sp.]|nr:hypothetical protein [Anaplasma sp.]
GFIQKCRTLVIFECMCVTPPSLMPEGSVGNEYCKRLNFREDLIFANFAYRLRFAKNRSREQFGQYVNTTEARFDSRKLEPANNFKFSALVRFGEI